MQIGSRYGWRARPVTKMVWDLWFAFHAKARNYIRHSLRDQSVWAKHQSQSISGWHITLTVDEIEVTWPNGTKEYFTGIESNQMVRLVEGAGETDKPLWWWELMTKGIEAFNVFPNPFKNEIIHHNGTGTELHWMHFSLVDISGRQVYYEKRSGGGKCQILISNCTHSGNYFRALPLLRESLPQE